MTQPGSHFRPLLAALLCLAPACGDKAGDETGDTTGTTGTTDSAGETSGTEPTGGGVQSEILVGSFQVQLVAPVAASEGNPGTAGKTAVVGKVYDGPTPAQIVWEEGTQSGACRLLTPRVPFCSTPCGGSAACVEDETCEPYPTATSAGTVTASGLKTEDGATTFAMMPIANNYQPPATAKLLYPAFAEGDVIRLQAAGDVAPAFEVSAWGIAGLELAAQDITLDGQSVALAWTAAESPTRSTVHVKLDISHHGGTRGMIECDGEDNGAMELPGALIGELLDLGVAGFPTIIVTRKSVGSVTIAAGRIDLVLSSAVERAVTIDGLLSCSDDAQCPDGQTCQDDLTCK